MDEREQSRNGLEIAIIGMSGRFPGAKSIDEFWENLKNGIETISFFSDQELDVAGISSVSMDSPNFVKAKGILDGVEYFDASFFDYKAIEAELMDPQMRVFHECIWEALENAAYDPARYGGRIGVYAGSSINFSWKILSHYSRGTRRLGNFYANTLCSKEYLCKRVSFQLNLRGPSFSMYTACSTSLVAIDLACKGILTGQCDMALAGGVSVSTPPKHGYMYSEGMINSPDGHCRTFDSKAQGTVFGNGVGVVMLKSLEEAEADNDFIYAVIKGSAINNDGINKANFTAPSREGQADVIRAALHMAEVESESIRYVEAHGTATQLGDPIEIESLIQAFNTDQKGCCAIGSVKSNMGHLDAAAGVAGFIKTVLALKHKVIPPSLHFEESNPKMDFKNSPFYVLTQLREWRKSQYPRRAGVSSFGVGGTNAHVVLEEAPVDSESVNRWVSEQVSRPYQLILLSAKTQSALDKITRNLAEYLKMNPGINLADAAYVLQVGRAAFDHRLMFVCSTVDEAVETLLSTGAPTTGTVYSIDEHKPVTFMFSGQGSQYVNMGLKLYETEKVFRQEMDRCFEILNGLLDHDIKESLYPSPVTSVSSVAKNNNEPTTNSEKINQTEIAQPMLFAFEYALAKLLIHWGITPQAMIGHSIGEYVAACLSGVFSLENALQLVVMRGRLMQQMPKGSMLGVVLGEEKLKSLLADTGDISLAAVNGPELCTVSGPDDSIKAFEETLNQQGYETRPLHTSHAFHSGMMDPVLKPFEEKVKEIQLNEPSIPFISNVTGTWVTAAQATDPGYWTIHIRKTMRFFDGLVELFKNENSIFVEVGPGKALTTFARQHINKNKEKKNKIINLIRHPRETTPDDAYLLNKIGLLWLCGGKIDWKEFYSEEKRHRISLPTYPFEGRRYWPDNSLFEDAVSGKTNLRKRKDITDWFYIPSWKRSQLPHYSGPGKESIDCCLVFTDRCGLGSRLLERLKQEGAEVVEVKKGSEFTRVDSQAYVLDPQEESHYNTLMEELKGKGKIPRAIIHLWNVTGKELPALEQEMIDKVQDTGYYSLLNLARAIGNQDIEEKIRVTVVSDNMQEVLGEAVYAPQKATLLGPVMVIPKEYPGISCRSIDIIRPEPGSGEEEILVEQLLLEIASDTPDSIIAYRNNIRWVRIYESIRLGETRPKDIRLKEKGVYLVTGGLGGIGLVLARYLAQHYKAKLVLTGRTAFPSSKDWQQWLEAHPPDDNISRKIREVWELEALGAEVLVLGADVSHQQQMQTAIDAAEQRFGCINGVVHSAGLPDAGVIQGRTRETTERVFAPKVYGTIVLDSVLKTREADLDFFVLCSSISSVNFPMGQVGYTAANAFLDAFSHYKNTNGASPLLPKCTPVISINWDTWQEVGMAVEAAKKYEGIVDISLKSGILPTEGADIFTRVLAEPLSQIITSTRDLHNMIELSMRSRETDNRTEVEVERVDSTEPKHQRPNLKSRYTAPGSDLEKKLAELWADVLGLDQVGIDDNFFDLGATSLDMVQVNSRLKKIMNKNIPLVNLYNHSTISALARYLSREEEAEEVSEEEKVQLKAISKGKSKLRQRGKRMKGEVNV